MNLRRRLVPVLGAVIVSAIVSGLSGCATGDDTVPEYQPRRDEGVSSIPWNRPEGWEGQTGLPGLGEFGTR